MSLVILLLIITGCSQDTDKTSLFDHEHAVPDHAPRSMWDLGQKIRERIALLEKSPDNAEAKSELNDLVSWSAEIAADTNIGEQRWMPIYEQSELLRESIEDDANRWDAARCDQAIRLCQLTDDAWHSLAPDQRVERYLGHDHSHDHGEHGDHSHSHGEHGEHSHSHGDKSHDHDDHQHSHQDGHSHGDQTHSHDDKHSGESKSKDSDS